MEKAQKYEKFINEVLRPDLKAVLDQRDQLYNEISAYQELKDKLQMVQREELSEIDSMTNLGSNFYVETHIPKTDRVFVEVGYGFHVEFTIPEALDFITKKDAHLHQKATLLTDKSLEIKSRIKMVYAGIQEILNLPTPEPERRVF
eukprot:gnl/Trimastix_PCT/3523.p1 GENE.gnl/Trimastix_PCT/3523~~gnl/Trimastix_PCT/3523.p1  ORF type:complete len:146 (+),score=13.57 gnl/Trimastix_PCT/3523:163-600(+)